MDGSLALDLTFIDIFGSICPSNIVLTSASVAHLKPVIQHAGHLNSDTASSLHYLGGYDETETFGLSRQPHQARFPSFCARVVVTELVFVLP